MQCVAGQVLGKPIAKLVVGGTPLNVYRPRNEILVTGLTEADGVFANKIIPGGYGPPCCSGDRTGDHLNARQIVDVDNSGDILWIPECGKQITEPKYF